MGEQALQVVTQESLLTLQLIQRATSAAYLAGSVGAGLRAKSKSHPISATSWLCPLARSTNSLSISFPIYMMET